MLGCQTIGQLLRDPRNGHLIIIVDGGMAKYKVQVERSWIDEFNNSKLETDWEVPDLSEYHTTLNSTALPSPGGSPPTASVPLILQMKNLFQIA